MFSDDVPAIRRAVLAMSMIAALASCPAGASDSGKETDEPIAFDIPVQSLSGALEAYGDVTGREVLYSSPLVEGHRSTAIEGIFPPEMALHKLLEGTGLVARFMPDRSFVLAPLPSSPPAKSAPAPVLQQYYARIQARLRDAFCFESNARSGRFRVTALLWLDPVGNVERYDRLGSVGFAEFDKWIDGTLQHLRIGAPPPDGFSQPVLIMIVPQGPGVTMTCDPASAESRPGEVE